MRGLTKKKGPLLSPPPLISRKLIAEFVKAAALSPSNLLLDVGGLGGHSRTQHSAQCEQQRLCCHCCLQTVSHRQWRVNRAQWEKPLCLACLNSPWHTVVCSPAWWFMGSPLHMFQLLRIDTDVTSLLRRTQHVHSDSSQWLSAREYGVMFVSQVLMNE